MHTHDFLYTDIRFIWTMNDSFAQQQVLLQIVHKNTNYICDILVIKI